MPCRDYDDDTNSSRAYNDMEQRLKARNDELARHACILGAVLEDIARAWRIPADELHEKIRVKHAAFGPAALKWWLAHKKADADRLKEEAKQDALKKQGRNLLDKLSAEDHEALKAVGVDLAKLTKFGKTAKTKKAA
jgi:hypothetical protein